MTREEVETFVGANHRVYWDLWQPALQDHKWFAGCNVAAGAFSFAWLLYRRMYREYFVLAAGELALGCVLVFASADSAARGLPLALSVLVNVGLGLLGNSLYLRRCRAAVEDVRQREPEPALRPSLLKPLGEMPISSSN